MMYLLDEDVASLCRMLDSDPEIALIRPDGDQRWKAHREIPTLPDGEHALWHIPSGPIILEPKPPKTRVKRVKDPFAGWTEIVSFQKGEPWFGPAPLGIIWLRIHRYAGPANVTFSPISMSRPWKAPASEVIGRSDFFWIGNYYSIIGEKVHPATEQWWKSIRKRIAKVAVQIPATGPINRTLKEIWAFPQVWRKSATACTAPTTRPNVFNE